jgi:AraC-like DNA-binding protein
MTQSLQGHDFTSMINQPEYPPIEGGLIQSVLLVDKLIRPNECSYRAPSLPGHLIHFVISGEAEQEVSGRHQTLTPGTIVWYHENEPVRGEIIQAPWEYYTVNFVAVQLPPPPFDQRVIRANQGLVGRFDALLATWRNGELSAIKRHMQVLALLLELLTDVMPTASFQHRVDMETHLWWDLEAKLREDLSRPIDLRLMQNLSRRSRQAIIRACHSAVGMPPIKRVKEIRLSYARGMVLYSRQRLTEIALSLGYSRVQELSRDYHKRYGLTPTEDRAAGGDYRTLPLRCPDG